MTTPLIGSLYGGLDMAVEAVTGGRTVWVCDNAPGPAAVLHGDITRPDHTPSEVTMYKWLKPDRRSPYRDWQWPEPGVWAEAEGGLDVCGNGLHVCPPEGLLRWCDFGGLELWVVEVDGDRIDAPDEGKVVVRRARLVRRVDAWSESLARTFAADCAERVLHLFESERPDDARPREAIAAARDRAADAAAGAAADPAGAAARAAGAAAWAAACAAADAAGAAADAAEAAADAAEAAEAGGAAERVWQTQHLLHLLGEREEPA